MKVLHLMDNGIVQSLALVSLWIVHDNCDSVERSLVQKNFKIIGVFCFLARISPQYPIKPFICWNTMVYPVSRQETI